LGPQEGQVFCPNGILWPEIDGSVSAKSIPDRPLLFDKSSDEDRPNDGALLRSRGMTELSAN